MIRIFSARIDYINIARELDRKPPTLPEKDFYVMRLQQMADGSLGNYMHYRNKYTFEKTFAQIDVYANEEDFDDRGIPRFCHMCELQSWETIANAKRMLRDIARERVNDFDAYDVEFTILPPCERRLQVMIALYRKPTAELAHDD